MNMRYGKLRWMLAITACLGLLAACKEPNSYSPPGADAASPAPEAAAAPEPAQAAIAGGASADAVPAQARSSIAELLANPLPGQLCNIEFIDGASFGANPSLTKGRFVIRGWLGDASGLRPADATLVLSREGVDSKTLLPISLNVARPDVEAYYSGTKGLSQSGFEAAVDVSSQQPGQFHLYLAYAIDGQGYICDNGRVVQLR